MVWVDIGKLSWDDFIKYSKIDYSYTKNVRYCKSLHIIYYKVVEGREVQIKSLSGFLHWSIGVCARFQNLMWDLVHLNKRIYIL